MATYNNVLIPFDLVYDTEIGLIKLIRDKYLDPEEFLPGMIKSDDKSLRTLLKMRAGKNPLEEFCVNPKDADEYYKQFMENKYDEILERSPETAIAKLIDNCIRYAVSSISITIAITDGREIDIINNRFSDDYINCTVKSEVNTSDYDTIYTKNISDLALYNNPDYKGKNIYVSSHMHNFRVDTTGVVYPDVVISTLLLNQSDVYNINMYAEDDYAIIADQEQEGNNNE